MNDKKKSEKLIQELFFTYYINLIILLTIENNIKSKANVI